MSEFVGGYNEKIIDHFKNPRNVGEMEDADVKATEGSPACGDQVSLFLKIDPVTKVITDVKFQSYGCASNIATGSIITEMIKGKSIEEAKKVTWQEADKELGGLPKVKVHCAVLAVDAVKSAIEKYELKEGIKVPEKIDKEYVLKKLRHVINPVAGLDVVSTKMVQDVTVEGGKITVIVDLAEQHQFANNVKSEILERLEHLPGISRSEVKFTSVT